MRNLCSWPASLLDWGGVCVTSSVPRAPRQPSGSCPRILPSLPAPLACLPACPSACLTSATDSLAWEGGGWGGGGVWGDWVGGVSCHGGWGVAGRPGDTHFASGHPLFGVVQPPPPPPPPFSEWGYVPRVFSAPASSRKSWGGASRAPFITPLLYSSRIPYTALHDKSSSPTLLPSPPWPGCLGG